MYKSKAVEDTVTVGTHALYAPDGVPSTAWLLSHPKIRALLGTSPLKFPPLEPSFVDILVADYFSSVHPYYPLLGRSVFLTHQRDVLRDGLQSTIESAICLCVYALAAIAASQPGVPLDGQFDHMGSIFMSPALKIMMSLSTFALQPSVESSQAWTLAAVWFTYLGRPLQSWKCISQAAANLQHLFHCDLRACFDLPPSCLRELEKDVPLPTYNDDEAAEAPFLVAEVHFRQLINNTNTQCEDHRDVIGPPQLIPGAFPEDEIPPGTPEELHDGLLRRASQLLCELDDWFEQLPREIKPSSERIEATSDQAKVLRARYYAAKIAIQRPLLLYASEQAFTDIPVSLVEVCEACVEDCKLLLLSMSQVSRKRSPYLWSLSQTALDVVLLLCVTYSSPHLSFLVEELLDLQELVIANLTRWSTPGSAFEAAIGIIERARMKQGLLRSRDS
ncbi:hypothetical protein H2199_006877 [Coniosporium tulheliwenetii]|uniref:Uncharacterized protein n=1 Tax=Coniosporium tulheliwenetii TaxID=3383036 RepID=A0ACC2YUN9_9PEZI|nr:hypothetical protein H2199_006877 [Cladosporium sp. JES 115]